jgi:prephenate dehydrogenase
MYKLLSNIVNKNCIITDVGSTKEDIVNYVSTIESDITFIGGHPMAGSEKTSYTFSNPHLFENAYYIITPLPSTNENHIKKLVELIKGINAFPITIPADEHDFITATISHVPHIIASSIVNVVKELDTENKFMHTLAANGFKDITRIASSSPTMWQQICLTNNIKIINVLNHLINNLKSIKNHITDSNETEIYDFFEQALHYRDSFQERSHSLVECYEITVDVIDEPGIIAKIATILSFHDINIKNIGIINNREYSKGVLEIVFSDKLSQERSIDILENMKFKVYKR